MYNFEEYLQLAQHASANRNPHACLGYLNEALKIEPENLRAICLVAVQHAELGLIERGIAGLTKVIELDPKLEIARLQLGLLMLDRGQTAEARQQFSVSRTSADQALRAFAEGMVLAIDGELAASAKMMQAGLALPMTNDTLRALMEGVLKRTENVSTTEAAQAQVTATDNNRLFMGAYQSTSPLR